MHEAQHRSWSIEIFPKGRASNFAAYKSCNRSHDELESFRHWPACQHSLYFHVNLWLFLYFAIVASLCVVWFFFFAVIVSSVQFHLFIIVFVIVISHLLLFTINSFAFSISVCSCYNLSSLSNDKVS